MKVPFQAVDVFTDRQFGGNPVAVIPDAYAAFRTLKYENHRKRSILLRQLCIASGRSRERRSRAHIARLAHLRCRSRAIRTLALRFVLAHQGAVCSAQF